MMNKKRIDAFDYLRSLATILVVLGHSAFYTITTNTPEIGIDFSQSIIDNTIIYRLYIIFGGLIYSCHMHVFMVLSGMIYAFSLGSGKYTNFKIFIKNKLKRLLIPYVLVSLLYNIPVLLISGYFNSNNLFYNIWLYLIGFGKNHLWFLITLVYIFFIVHIIYIIKNKMVFLVVYFFSVILCIFIDSGIIQLTELLYVDRLCLYLFWFMTGVIVHYFLQNKKSCITYDHVPRYFPWIMLVVWLLVYGGYRVSKIYVLFFMARITGVIFFVLLSIFLSERKIKKIEHYNTKLCDLSFDIYLYGVPLNYIVLVAFVSIFPVPYSMSWFSSGGLIILRIITQMLIPMFIHYIVCWGKNLTKQNQ